MVDSSKSKSEIQTEGSILSTEVDDKTMVRRQVENPNRKIGDYHLLRVIGTGTFGKVYLALLNG